MGRNGSGIAKDSKSGRFVARYTDEVGKRRTKQYISTAIQELLKIDPDMTTADAALAAAEATGEKPTPALFRAKKMATKVRVYSGTRKKSVRRKVTKKKAKRKTAKKKSS